MKVEVSARAIAANVKTKALITPAPRQVSAPKMYVWISTQQQSQWHSQNLCRPLLSSQTLIIYIIYITHHNFLYTQSVICSTISLYQECKYVPRNLGICAISRLCCAFWESGNCVSILRLHNMSVQSQDCTSAIHKHNRLTVWERLSWLTEESWNLTEMGMPWTPQEFLQVCELPRSPWHRGLEYCPDSCAAGYLPYLW